MKDIDEKYAAVEAAAARAADALGLSRLETNEEFAIVATALRRCENYTDKFLQEHGSCRYHDALLAHQGNLKCILDDLNDALATKILEKK